jgi:SNF2 family DNA or RNA helicase
VSQPYTPHPYQLRAIKFAVGQAVAGMLLDMGMGKCSIMLAVIKTLLKQGHVKKVLIVAPLRVASITWPDERAKWNDFHDLRMVVLHGPQKEALLASPHDVATINPEGLPWLFQARRGHPPYDMLVVDESTLFKNTQTQRFRLIKPLLKTFKRRYILTGEPSPNGLLDLFGQMYLLDEGYALGSYITRYRLAHFMNPDGQGWEWVIRPGEEQKIYEKIAPYVLRLDAKDYLQMPPLRENDVFVDLPPKARRAYQQMEAALLTQIEDRTITAANAAVASSKCRQIASGGLYTTPPEWVDVHDAKLEALQEIIDSHQGKPVLVSYQFDHEREKIQKAYPKAPHIGGGVAHHAFKKISDDWNAGRIPVLLAQPQSVAHGLNLQQGGHVGVWYSPTWNRDYYSQFNARIYRQGQKHPVTIHRIASRNTVDMAVLKALTLKGNAQQSLLDALKSYGGSR